MSAKEKACEYKEKGRFREGDKYRHEAPGVARAGESAVFPDSSAVATHAVGSAAAAPLREEPVITPCRLSTPGRGDRKFRSHVVRGVSQPRRRRRVTTTTAQSPTAKPDWSTLRATHGENVLLRSELLRQAGIEPALSALRQGVTPLHHRFYADRTLHRYSRCGDLSAFTRHPYQMRELKILVPQTISFTLHTRHCGKLRPSLTPFTESFI
ncbi:unnamed protein product [Heligmosomoides polygyrus]|uniref:Uncharacterized protein n=1 Tax=Heligmosomoides polygyrus TaxID=6339 RepID=A0A183G6X0_HELPZ|nr:unnamed protein product [Heligmosomoides polygyrus]